MSESTLSFTSSATFRNILMGKNLQPYNIPGAFSSPASNVNYEISPLSDINVIDSPNNYISSNQFANGLYPLNEFGPEGGFTGKYSVPGSPLPIESNQGPYDPNGTNLDLINEFFIDSAYIQNKYGPEGGFNDLVIITDIQLSEQYFQSYNEPFVNSLYKPYQILVNSNPVGTNGNLSQDTFLAKIAATNLKKAFEERIAYESTYLNSFGPSVPLGFGNLDTLNSPFSNLFTNFNNQPLYNRDWKITSPEESSATNTQFTNRLQENYYPSSPIPGSYFDTFSPIQAPVAETALENINNITGGLGPILNILRSPSELFISNTGKGQKSVLFNSLDYNTYRPSYNRGTVSENLQNAITNFLDNDPQITGKYYVGSAFSEPSLITSPPNQVAVNAFGAQQNTIVYGPSELGNLYEGNEQKLNFGLKAESFTDNGNITGEFVWTSPKYNSNAGFTVKPGGDPSVIDPEFNIINSQYSQNLSTGFEFKNGSILDDTQRIINAADNVTGAARLKHVGTAINQVSKVFNDGYKEITKGSRVISYVDSTTESEIIGISGVEVGREYCRLFQKDTPYFTYGDLQKTDGITISGRKFHNSVLDNTYNLNIAPLRGNESTNIRNGKVKKYMFSLENLAWRTSSQPGFTYEDLPNCERGPNGGRIMWFPPYDLSFSEDTKASWNQTKFLGRPEPVFTYQNSSRSGSISWKIVVDNPSMMNTIVEKQLSNKSDKEINSIVDSFFAGCVKYDLYTLAAKFNQIPISELYTYQEILNNPNSTAEEKNTVLKEISKTETEKTGGGDNSNQTVSGDKNGNNTKKESNENQVISSEIQTKDIRLYFDSGIPRWDNGEVPNARINDITATYDYEYYYNEYTNTTKIDKYIRNAKRYGGYTNTLANGTVINWTATTAEQYGVNMKNFFEDEIKKNKDDLDNFLLEVENLLLNNQKVFIKLTTTASAASQDQQQNLALSKRRYDSVVKYFSKRNTADGATFKKYIDNGSLEFTPIEDAAQGNLFDVFVNGQEINCRENVTRISNNDNSDGVQQWAIPSMACRSVRIIGVKQQPIQEDPIVNEDVVIEENNQENVIIIPPKKNPPKVDIIKKLKDGISKKILRNLFSECDYFETIKETNPMVYSSIKEKIKFFNPAFHSTTPEGLNSRLTFLNQCMRPGQTIPVIGPDGKPKFNDALNTSFGTPPVLVLRIGDFYHTKIIPNSLGIQYDPIIYDINPEGIGVQPMIAKITLGFDFIGGSGLATPIKQLQNALSFNYYANTEIYDERAIATEDTSQRDKELEKILVDNSGPTVTNKDVPNTVEKKGQNAIGIVSNTTFVDSGAIELGEIEYYNIMKELEDNTKNYFTNIVNQTKTITEITNWGIAQLVYNKRNYSDGKILEYDQTENKTTIYGKTDNVENRFSKLIDNCVKDINNDTNPIILQIKTIPNIPSEVLRGIKETMKNAVKSNEIELNTLVQKPSTDIVTQEEGYNYTFRKLDVVCFKLDGLKDKNGDIKVYSLTATPENTLIDYMTETYRNVGQVLSQYSLFLKDENILGESFYDNDLTAYNAQFAGTKIKKIEEKRYYMGMCNILLNENSFNSFTQKLITNDVKKYPTLELKITETLKEFQQNCVNDHKIELELFSKLETKDSYIGYKNFLINVSIDDSTVQTVDYFKGKKVGYTTENIGDQQSKKKKLKDLYSNNNVNGNQKTFNGKVTFN